MTRVEAAAFADALEEFMAEVNADGEFYNSRRVMAARERLIDRLCGGEVTQPLTDLAGNERKEP